LFVDNPESEIRASPALLKLINDMSHDRLIKELKQSVNPGSGQLSVVVFVWDLLTQPSNQDILWAIGTAFWNGHAYIAAFLFARCDWRSPRLVLRILTDGVARNRRSCRTAAAVHDS
jgi:hypothetical protein